MPSSHVSLPSLYSLSNTLSWTLKLLVSFLLSVRVFRLGNNLSDTNFTFLANINSAGNMPDCVLGLRCYTVNSWEILKCVFTYFLRTCFFSTLLNVSTNRSACPFDLEWYGEVVICSMQNVLQKTSNSLLVNCVHYQRLWYLVCRI